MNLDKTIEIVTYSGIEVIIRDDGYINATALCKEAGKLFKDYHRNLSTKAFLEEFSSVLGIPLTAVVQISQGGVPQEQGTWVHPDIATNLAQWLSPMYAVKVTKVLKDYHNKGLVVNKRVDQLDVLEQMFGVFKQQQLEIQEVKQSQLETKNNVKLLEHKQDDLENSLHVDGPERGQLKTLVDLITDASPTLHWRNVWGTFNKRFGLASYHSLPKKRFTEAKEFLALWLENEKVTNTLPDQQGLFEGVTA